MYLFGFPEGLAGGSKETEYATGWDTSRTTNYAYTNWNSSWNTYKTTSRSTTKSRVVYLHAYNWTPKHQTNYWWVRVYQWGAGNLAYQFWYAGASHIQPHAIGTWDITNRHGSHYNNRWASIGGFTYSTSGVADRTIALPGSGADPSVNVGAIINTTAITTDYRNYGAFKLKIGPLASQSDTTWEYAITIAESLNLNAQLYSYRSFSLSPYTGTQNYSASTSYSTLASNTSRSTSLSTTHGTTYETNQLTSHITYG